MSNQSKCTDDELEVQEMVEDREGGLANGRCSSEAMGKYIEV